MLNNDFDPAAGGFKLIAFMFLIATVFIITIIVEKPRETRKIESGQNKVIIREEPVESVKPAAHVVHVKKVIMPSAFNEVEVTLAVDFSTPQNKEQIVNQSELLSKLIGASTTINNVEVLQVSTTVGKERCVIIGHKDNKEQELDRDNTR